MKIFTLLLCLAPAVCFAEVVSVEGTSFPTLNTTEIEPLEGIIDFGSGAYQINDDSGIFLFGGDITALTTRQITWVDLVNNTSLTAFSASGPTESEFPYSGFETWLYISDTNQSDPTYSTITKMVPVGEPLSILLLLTALPFFRFLKS